jgi:SAM-dependent methyltransferase
MQLTSHDFCDLLGIAGESLPDVCQAFIRKTSFEYEIPDTDSRDRIILSVLKHLASEKPTKVGAQRAEIWESCWAENLNRYISADHNPDKLLPDFIRTGQPVRLRQQYVIPKAAGFEANFLQVCRAYLFDRFFKDVASVYEFGCGSGFNLVALADQFPGKRMFGLDWSKSANETVNLLRSNLGIDITGRNFDFFAPDSSLKLDNKCGVLTMCALEQVGIRHETFINFVLAQRPGICLHMEPLVDLYDENNLIDHLAIIYHKKREYLSGFLPYLKHLAASGKIEIIDTRRMFFGSLYHEGYSFVAWRPV